MQTILLNTGIPFNRMLDDEGIGSEENMGHFLVRCNGQYIRGQESGPSDGPPVVLLHGFPEFSFSWRYQIPMFARAGFHVIAPDLRGYNLSSKPKRVADYRVKALVGDVVSLIEQMVGGRAAVVGHDWGGIIGWHTAMWHPAHISRLAILNAPHPAAYFRELWTPAQLMRSWYVFFFHKVPAVKGSNTRASGKPEGVTPFQAPPPSALRNSMPSPAAKITLARTAVPKLHLAD